MGLLPFETGLVLLAALLLLLPGARWQGWVAVGWLLLAAPLAAFLVADGGGSPAEVSGLALPGGFLLGNAGLLGAGLLAIGIGGGRVWHGAAATAGLLWLWPILQSAWPMVVPSALLLGALMLALAGLVRVLRPGWLFRALEKRWGSDAEAERGLRTTPLLVLGGLPLLLLVLPLPVNVRIIGAGGVVLLAWVLVPEIRRPATFLNGVVVLALLGAVFVLPRDLWLVPGVGAAAWVLSGLWPWHRFPGGIMLAPVSLLLLRTMGTVAMPLGVRYWDVAALGALLLGLAHAVAVRDGARGLGVLALATAWLATPGSWSSGEVASVTLMMGALVIRFSAPAVGRWPIVTRRLAVVPLAWGFLQFLQGGLASEVVLTLLVSLLVAGARLARFGGTGRVAPAS